MTSCTWNRGCPTKSVIDHRTWSIIGHSTMILADSLCVLCKLAYFNSTATEQRLIISLQNSVPIKKTPVLSCHILKLHWISLTPLKIHAAELSHFIKEIFSRPPMFAHCSLTVTSMWWPGLIAHYPIREYHFAGRDVSVDKKFFSVKT